MPSFSAKLSVIEFDAPRYLVAFDKAMQTLNKRAAGAWLDAVVQRIPVRTGMAAGSLLPLAGYLRMSHVNLFSGFVVSPVDEPDRRALGAELSDDPRSMFVSPAPGQYFFNFNINVEHYRLNELGLVGPYLHPIDPAIQPPWNSMVVGAAAYEEYVRVNLPTSIPRITDYVVVTLVNNA